MARTVLIAITLAALAPRARADVEKGERVRKRTQQLLASLGKRQYRPFLAALAASVEVERLPFSEKGCRRELGVTRAIVEGRRRKKLATCVATGLSLSPRTRFAVLENGDTGWTIELDIGMQIPLELQVDLVGGRLQIANIWGPEPVVGELEGTYDFEMAEGGWLRAYDF